MSDQGLFSDGWDEFEQDTGLTTPDKAAKRLYLNYGDMTALIMLSSSPTGIWEHRVPIDGSWSNYFTCVLDHEEFDSCPLCELDDYDRRKRAVFSVVQLARVTSDEQNAERKKQALESASDIRDLNYEPTDAERKLVVAPKTVYSTLKRRARQNDDNLAGLPFIVTRLEGQAVPNVGNDWVVCGDRFEEEELKEEFGEERVIEYDYEEEFKPEPMEKLENVANIVDDTTKGSGSGSSSSSSGGASGGNEEDFEDIPL